MSDPMRLVRSFADTLRRSWNPETADDAWLVNGQLDLLRQSTRWFAYIIPLAGLALTAVVADTVSAVLVGTWLAALTAVCAGGEAWARHVDSQTTSGDIAAARKRAHAYVTITLAVSLIWGAIGVWLWFPQSAELTMFARLTLTATLCALSVFTAVHAASALGPLIFVSFISVARSFFVPNMMNPRLGTLSALFVLLMVGLAIAVYSKNTKLLCLERERRRLIDSLRAAKIESDEARERAVAASMAKSEFLANMSHDLRTPLNAIIGFSDIIKTNAFGSALEKYAEYGSYIHQSGNHLLGLITNVLELAKIEAGRKILQEEIVDVAGQIYDAVQDAKEFAKDASITADVAAHLPLLTGDVRAVRQIIDHLLAHSLKAAPRGEVSVRACVNAAGEMLLSIRDNGEGIALEDQSSFFDRFGRGRHDLAQNQSGLGLSIVKGLIELHGGRVMLRSEQGEGTEITIVFPARRSLPSKDQRVA
jgi:two-component system cell cycle sensor histidine kinase PleC